MPSAHELPTEKSAIRAIDESFGGIFTVGYARHEQPVLQRASLASSKIGCAAATPSALEHRGAVGAAAADRDTAVRNDSLPPV